MRYIIITKMSGKITKLRMMGAINMYFIRTGQYNECVEKLKKEIQKKSSRNTI